MSNRFDINSGVFQARSLEIAYTFTTDGQPVSGVTKAKYVIYAETRLGSVSGGKPLVEVELNNGITVDDGTFSIKVDADLMKEAKGRLQHELFYEDSQGNISQVFMGNIIINETKGRF